MHPCGPLEVYQTLKSHNALIDLFKFISYVQINTRITSSLSFLYIFNQSGLLCAAARRLLQFCQKLSGQLPPTPLPTRHLRPWAKLILICIWAFISIFDLLFQKPSLKRRPKRNFSQQGGHVRRNGDPPITWYQPPPRFGYVKYFRVFGVRTVFDLLMVFKDF